jgi:hypothetical protein
MRYKRLQEKELSREQERRLLEEINRKMSGVDLVLSKARAQMETMSVLDEEKELKEEIEEEKKGSAACTESGKAGKLDLFRVYNHA